MAKSTSKPPGPTWLRRTLDRLGRQEDPTSAPPPPTAYECALPRHFFIDVGNVCNLHCPFCPTGMKVAGTPRGFMSLDWFHVIFSKIKDVAELVCLYNWGEPFLNKDILAMARICADHGVPAHIDSNLSMRDFTPEQADAIVDSGVYSIFASIDGASQKAYEKYRVGGKLSRAIGNLTLLNQSRTRRSSRTPLLAWAYCVHKFNEHEIEQAQAAAAEIGVPVFFRLLSTEDEAWLSSYHADPDHPILKAPQWWPEYYPTPQTMGPDVITLDPTLPAVCGQPFSTMVIDWNGEVTPCCAVYGRQYRLGNLLEQDLETVWNGSEFQKCRDFLIHYGHGGKTGSVCESLPCLVTTGDDNR